MDDLKHIDWLSLRSAEHEWVNEHLTAHPIIEKDKFITRLHSIDFSGTQQDLTALVDAVADSIEKYVYDSKQRERFEKRGVNAFRKAVSFFGETNPDMDGKYGELLLYILAEAILGIPLVSHKITLLTNVNDQVKGGDGIFFGNYRDEISILIGESKIHQSFSNALDSSLSSLDRFHQNYSTSALDHELFIARSNISQNFNLDQMEKLFDAFTPGSREYKACNKAHPVLLVFETNEISNIEKKAKNREDACSLFSIWAQKRIESAVKLLEEKLSNYSELEKIYLDLFLIPLNNVSHFKHSLYKAIHGVEYSSQGK